MRPNRRLPPVWLMCLSNASVGFVTGIVFFVLPQLMAALHVPESRIAWITAAAMSANFSFVLFSPMLDVRFSRRWYATCFDLCAALLIAETVINIRHLVFLAFALVLAVGASGLAAAAVGGWLSAICPPQKRGTLSAWMNIALISGTGISSAVGAELVRYLPVPIAATLLGALVLAPAAIFPFIPSPPPDRQLAAESFGRFAREVLALLRRQDILIVLLLFLSPCGTFALTSVLGGFGTDFQASARAVSLAGGIGAFVSGLVGSLLFPFFASRVPLRSLYLVNGILGASFSLGLLLLPHTAAVFAFALLGEYFFQAVSFASQIGIVFQTIGQNNPLAATIFAFLTAATNIPVTYMVAVDGRGYASGGIAATLALDGGIGIATCLLALLLFRIAGSVFGAHLPADHLLTTEMAPAPATAL